MDVHGPIPDSWFDLHEAIRHEVAALAHDASTLDAATVGAYADRFGFFAQELRIHSEVEDGILFPALAERGEPVDSGYTGEHHIEQQLVYDIGTSLFGIAALDGRFDVSRAIRDVSTRVHDLDAHLRPHLRLEEDELLPAVARLFSADEQGWLLSRIIAVVPPDPRMQPWVAAALRPEHRDVRLAHLHDSLPHERFVVVMQQIRDGVAPEVWADIAARQPDLVAAVDAAEHASDASHRTG